MNYNKSELITIAGSDLVLDCNQSSTTALLSISASKDYVILAYSDRLHAYSVNDDGSVVLVKSIFTIDLSEDVDYITSCTIAKVDRNGEDMAVVAYGEKDNIKVGMFRLDEVSGVSVEFILASVDRLDSTTVLYKYKYSDNIVVLDSKSNTQYLEYSELIGKHIATIDNSLTLEPPTIRTTNDYELDLDKYDEYSNKISSSNAPQVMLLKHPNSSQPPIFATFEQSTYFRYWDDDVSMLGLIHDKMGLMHTKSCAKDPDAPDDTPTNTNLPISIHIPAAISISSFNYNFTSYLIILSQGQLRIVRVELGIANMIKPLQSTEFKIDPLITSACIAIQEGESYKPVLVLGGSHNRPLMAVPFDMLIDNKYNPVSIISDAEKRYIKANEMTLNVSAMDKLCGFQVKSNSIEPPVRTCAITKDMKIRYMSEEDIEKADIDMAALVRPLEVYGLLYQVSWGRLYLVDGTGYRCVVEKTSRYTFTMFVIYNRNGPTIESSKSSPRIYLPIDHEYRADYRVSIDTDQKIYSSISYDKETTVMGNCQEKLRLAHGAYLRIDEDLDWYRLKIFFTKA